MAYVRLPCPIGSVMARSAGEAAPRAAAFSCADRTIGGESQEGKEINDGKKSRSLSSLISLSSLSPQTVMTSLSLAAARANMPLTTPRLSGLSQPDKNTRIPKVTTQRYMYATTA